MMSDEDWQAYEAWQERHPDPTLASMLYYFMLTFYFIAINIILLFNLYIFSAALADTVKVLRFQHDDEGPLPAIFTMIMAMFMIYYSCNVGLTVEGEHWRWYWNAFLELSKPFAVLAALETAVAALVAVGVKLCRQCWCAVESGIGQRDEEAALVNESIGIELDDVDKLAATHDECGRADQDNLRRKRLEYFVHKFGRAGDGKGATSSCRPPLYSFDCSMDVEHEWERGGAVESDHSCVE